MSFNMSGIPATLIAAAASYSKGQEVSQDASGETREKNRIGRQIFVKEKTDEEMKKPSGTQKGVLA